MLRNEGPSLRNEGKFKFYPRVINQTDLEFTNEEYTLLDKGLKYNLGQKHKHWIRNLALEAERAVTLLPPEEQDSCVNKWPNT